MRLAEICFVVWVSVHLGAIASVALPAPYGGGKLPWSMFASQTTSWSRAFAQAEIDGAWVELPLDDWFRYRRGATTFSLVHEAPELKGPRPGERKAAFAAWCAAKARDEGLGSPTAIRLGRRIHPLDGGDPRELDYGTWPVTP